MRHRGGGVGHKGMRFANCFLLSEEHAVVASDNEDGSTGKGDGEGGGDVEMSDGHESNRLEDDDHKDEDDEDLGGDDEAIIDGAGFGSL